MQDIFLTPHFTLRELTESQAAKKYGIDNSPSPVEVMNLQKLCANTLEPLREALGLPIIITSGYRCKTLNNKVSHHSTRSQHMNGQAADFWVQGSKSKVQGESVQGRRELLILAFRLIIESSDIDYDQLIIYPSFIHVSYVSRERNRHKLTKGFGNGKYCALTRADALAIS